MVNEGKVTDELRRVARRGRYGETDAKTKGTGEERRKGLLSSSSSHRQRQGRLSAAQRASQCHASRAKAVSRTSMRKGREREAHSEERMADESTGKDGEDDGTGEAHREQHEDV